MIEPKVSLSLLVRGAGMLSSQECEKNPKESYNEKKMLVSIPKGKGKNKKEVKKLVVIKTRKQKLITQNISICDEAYQHMISTPTSAKFARPVKTNKAGEIVKRVWDTLSVDERLKHHFNQIAHDLGAVSFSYEVLKD